MNKGDSHWRTKPDTWEKLKPLAHVKRNGPAEAERNLWKYLRERQLGGFIFRRQHAIGQFIVDFYCYKARLIVEVEGEIHRFQKKEDKARQDYLESLGLTVLYFSNDMVLNEVQVVLDKIKAFLSGKV